MVELVQALEPDRTARCPDSEREPAEVVAHPSVGDRTTDVQQIRQRCIAHPLHVEVFADLFTAVWIVVAYAEAGGLPAS